MLKKAFEGPVSIVSLIVTMSGHHPVVERKGGGGREGRKRGRERSKKGRKRKKGKERRKQTT